MSKGGGGGGTTQTVQKADPWIGVQPGLNQLYSSALNWFNSDSPQQYPGERVAAPTWDTNHALQLGEGRAMAGNQQVNETKNLVNNTLGGAFLHDTPSNPYYQSVLSGSNPAASFYTNLLSGNTSNDPALAYLTTATNGGFMDKQNPYLKGLYTSATDPLVQQFRDATAPSIASQFSAAGRFGSGAHEQAITNAEQPLAQGLASAASSIYGGAYENERNRQQAAATTLSGLRTGAASGLGNLQSAAAGGLGSNFNFERGMEEQAMQMAPTLAANDYTDIDKLMKIGQFQQSTNQDYINEAVNKFDFSQNQPLNKLQALNALLQGGAAYAGSSSTQNTSLNRNPFASAVGGAAAGGALAGMSEGSVGGPFGMLAGALLGGLFG